MPIIGRFAKNIRGVQALLTRVRATAHRIADFVYEKLTGEKGVFSTRIAYVVKRGNRFELQIADADGAGEEAALVSFEPIISPAIDTEPRFSGDGQWIYFTSDRGGSPQIYRMPAAGGEPQRVTFEGSYNVTPRLSPDGKTLAYITLNEGKFQVALLDLSNRQVQIITDSDRDESP